jgi:tripartite-type tricarboxylate transporter receptor subunit TctC
MAHVPYRGATPAVNDLIAGQVPVGFITYGTILPFVKDGKARVLGLVGDTRSTLAPDVPLIRDHVPDYVSAPNGWHAILAPAGTPPDIVAKLNKDVNEALSDPGMRKRIADTHYYELVGGTPQDLTEKMRKETEIADRLAAKMGIKKQ